MLDLGITDPFLVLAVLLMAGMALGWIAQRIGLPGITGQILAGIALGPSVLAVFDEAAIAGLEPLTYFALALIGVTVGAHLNLRRLRNAGTRLVLLLAAEALIVPAITAVALLTLTETPGLLVVLLAPLAISTAPATVVAVVGETRSRGVLVKTLIAAVAINNITCILLFEIARQIAGIEIEGEVHLAELSGVWLLSALAAPMRDVAGAILLGASAGGAAHLVTLRIVRPDRLTTVSAITILLTFGAAAALSFSPLLAALALGVVQTNLNPERDRLVDSVFANFEPIILCVFFTVAGFHLSFEQAGVASVAASVFFLARALGKLVAGRLAMTLANATRSLRENLGLALLPQAGVAVGLVILIENDPRFDAYEPLFVAIVLTSVTFAEIFGPVATRLALARAGEVGADRPRLVDFLQEENITTNLRADSMEDAIDQLTSFLISSHHLVGVDRDALYASVIRREREVSTCVGGGLAVPHGELPEKYPMLGVMGISSQGLDIETPDGRPLHCIVLLATPRDQRDRHLAVLASLARMFGSDPAIQQQVYTAKSAAHAFEILHGDDAEDFNYFLDEDDA